MAKDFPTHSISLLHSKEFFATNFKTATKKIFFNGATSHWFLYFTSSPIPSNDFSPSIIAIFGKSHQTPPPFYEGGGGFDCINHKSKESIQ